MLVPRRSRESAIARCPDHDDRPGGPQPAVTCPPRRPVLGAQGGTGSSGCRAASRPPAVRSGPPGRSSRRPGRDRQGRQRSVRPGRHAGARAANAATTMPGNPIWPGQRRSHPGISLTSASKKQTAAETGAPVAAASTTSAPPAGGVTSAPHRPAARGGSHLLDRFLQSPVDVLGIHVKLLGRLLLRPGHGVLDRVLDLAFPDHDEPGLARGDVVPELFGLRA